MNRKSIAKLAISAAFVATPGIGLTQMSVSAASSGKAAEAQAKKAYIWATKAEKLAAKGQNQKALRYAEAAVGADMQNVEYRSLLARLYMKNGRFASAERTLMDVMELGQTDPRTVVSLALARTAQGKTDSAIALVDANRSLLPASDYGLALALAGDTSRAVEVLVEAIRTDNATARTRQNLALAYALNGRWREAHVMAVQDMTKDLADKRLVEWAGYARPGAYQLRVAGLLGVTPQTDSGQPIRLALNLAPAVEQMAAVVPPVEAPAAVPETVTELAAIGPAPVEVAAVESAPAVDPEPAPAPAFEAPLIKAPEAPAKAPVKLAMADVAPAAARQVSGTHLVQLGAFSSNANAQAAWSKYVKKHSVLQGFDSASSTVTVNGRKLVRLAAMGFGNKASADAACRAIKSGGGDCIVRAVGGQAPVRMAARKPVKVAAR